MPTFVLFGILCATARAAAQTHFCQRLCETRTADFGLRWSRLDAGWQPSCAERSSKICGRNHKRRGFHFHKRRGFHFRETEALQ